jgi:chemotaxis protein methyltransferase CheR
MDELAATPDNLWMRVSRHLESEIGLHFSAEQRADLERGLAAAAKHFGLPDAKTCAAFLLTQRVTAAERQVLAQCLAIGETYFFRDESFFRNLEFAILPELLRDRREKGRRLRLWSAGCSTGEEPYSVAMLLAGMLPDWREWDISILATDLNAEALRKARAGIYRQWSIRSNLPASAKRFLATRPDGHHEVHPDIRRLVRFDALNLADDCYPSVSNSTTAMDLVLCRNVLIYFESRRVAAVLTRLGRALAPDGWLLATSAELPVARMPGLRRVGLPDMVAMRREDPPQAAAAAAPAPLAPPAARRILPALPPLPVRPVTSTPTTPVPQPADEPAGLASLARTCADSGDLERAATLCRQAMEADKSDPELPYLLATILSEQGLAKEAGSALRRTLYLCPDHVLAHVSLGNMALREGQARALQRHFSAALVQLSARDPQAVLEGSGGMSCGELEAIITGTLRAAHP